MSVLHYPTWAGLLGDAAGYVVFIGSRCLMLLPDTALARVLAVAGKALYAIVGESEETRMMHDLAEIFARGGPHSAGFRRLVEGSSAADMVDVVRGAVVRRLT